MDYLLGIDFGTSGVKVAVFEAETLALAGEGSTTYPVLHPQAGFAEQSPQDWLDGLKTAVHQATASINKSNIRAIGIDAQMHGLVCVDTAYQPLGNAIIWADGRSATQVAQLEAMRSQFAVTLPGPPAAGFAAATALWLHTHQPERLAKTAVLLQPKDYIRLWLTGELASEPSDAAASWLFDLASGSWANEVLAACGVRAQQMPPLVPSAQVAGQLREKTAVLLNLPANIPVVAGAADLAAQALGHGVTEPEQTLITIGSGGQLVIPQTSPKPANLAGTYTFPHALPNRWYTQAAILSAGLSLRWLRDIVSTGSEKIDYATLSAMAEETPLTADQPIFLPYLSGERTPHMNVDATAVFFGLRAHHSTGHLVQAVMAGVGFALLDCLNLFPPQDAPIVLSGGIVNSPVWVQMVADIWKRPLHIYSSDIPRAALGSVILAGLGVGMWENVDTIRARLQDGVTTIQPKPSAIYDVLYGKYGRVYHQLVELY